METSSEAAHFAIGQQLAAFLRSHGGDLLTVSALQGVVSDLAAGDVELVLPLKHLIALPGFRVMAHKAGSGKGLLERDALLQSVGDLFSPRITGALGEVLNGFLDLPDRARPIATEVVVEPDWDPDPKGSTDPCRRTAETAPPSAPDAPPTPWSTSAPEHSSHRPLLLAFLTAGGFAIGVSLIVLTRVSPFCLVFNTCPGLQKVQAESDRRLELATKAITTLEQATDLESYQRAADQLDAALSKLNTLELNPEQRGTLEKLQQVAFRSREAIAEEKLDQERLLRAEQAIDSARGLNGEGRQAQLDAARLDLQPISGAGFAATRARELRLQLDSLQAEATANPSAASPKDPVSSGSPSTEPQPPQAPAPTPRTTWTPPPRSSTPNYRPYSHSSSGSRGGATSRSQPLWSSGSSNGAPLRSQPLW